MLFPLVPLLRLLSPSFPPLSGTKAATALHIWLRAVVEAEERIKIFLPGAPTAGMFHRSRVVSSSVVLRVVFRVVLRVST